MAYTKVNWTELIPISAANLATMDTGIETIDTNLTTNVDGNVKVVQVEYDTCAADSNTTTSTTYTDTNLSVAITPKFNDSLIVAIFSGDMNDGTYVRLYNSTNSAALDGASGAYDTASGTIPVTQTGIYEVNSTTARTFKLQYMSYSAAHTSKICDYSTGLLVAFEVRP